MPGLLDIFNNMTPEQNQGLLAAAASILQQSEPSRRPFTLGQAVGTGIGAFQGSMDHQRARKLAEQEAQQMAELRGFAIKDKQSDYAAQELARQRARELDVLRNSYKPRGQQSAPPVDRSASAVMQGLMSGGMGEMPAPGAPMPASMSAAPGSNRSTLVQDRLDYAQYLWQNGFGAEAQAEEDSALKLQPKVKEWQKVTVDGKVMYAPYFEDGSNGQPVPLEVAEKLEAINRGGTTDLVNQFTGATVRSLQNSASPESLLAAETARRGQNMTDARARDLNALTREGQQTQVINDPLRGLLLVDKGTGAARQATMNGKALPSEQEAKRAAAAKNLLPLIHQADKLIDGATGSYAGAASDQVARFFGNATGGAQNIAQLRVLEGNLMMAQPRMEGPQSNTDVLLYRQMAAQIGDPTVPNEAKKAALSTLRALYTKYEPQASAGNGTPGDIADLLNKYGGN
jgi:hypothetical protein